MLALDFNPNGHHHAGADFLRVVFGFAPAAVLVGLVVAVVFSYYRAWKITRFRGARTGLLPKHVWTIGISYLVFIADSVYSLIERLHHQLTPHTFIVFPGYLLGIYSLNLVLHFERLRFRTESGVNTDLGPTDGV